MPTENRYVAIAPCELPCDGETFNAQGVPEKCRETRVLELSHSNGRKLHLCEYHIECYWSFWLTFREAIRDVWPVRQRPNS